MDKIDTISKGAGPGERLGRAGVLFGSVLGIGAGVSALLLYTNGLFVAGLTHEFGLTRTAFGFGVFLVTLALAVANPVVGWAIDRFGARPVATVGLVAMTFGFVAMATLVTSVRSYIVVQALVALVAAASGPAAYTKTVSGWFHRHRGLALGVTLTGIGLAAAVVPPVVARMIGAHGWRSGYWLLAAISTGGLIPVTLFLRPAKPQFDLTPAGVAPAGHAIIDSPFTSRAFWTMILAFFVMALAFAGLLPHFVPLLIDKGVPPLKAGGLAGVIGLAVIGSRVVVGWLVDRVFAPWIAIGVCGVAAAGCLVLLIFGASGAVVAAAAIGCAMGGEVDLISFLVARYFKPERFGRVYGWQYSSFILGSGFGPLWIGALHDKTGSYGLPLLLCMGGLFATCGLLALLPRYPLPPPA